MPKKGYKQIEEHKRRIGNAKRGHRKGMLGKHHSEETKKKISEFFKHKPFSEEHKRKIGTANKGKSKTEEHRIKLSKALKGRKGIPKTEEIKRRIGISSKQKWQNPEYAEKQITAIMKGNCIKPNKTEIKFGKLIDDMFPGEYKFVGDGQVIIGGKCPDFININGQKKIIELFGDYWHKGEDPQIRINLFKKYGYDTLVIWERELKNPEIVKKDILNFNNNQ